MYAEAERLAEETGGHYLDQFTNAERATDWRGNNNIAESIFEQMREEAHPIPDWIVVGAGTGGTSATIGRFIRYRRLPDPVVRRRPGELGVLPVLCAGSPRRRDGDVVADRGHRAAEGGAVIPAGRGGPDGLGARRGVDSGGTTRQRGAGPTRRAINGHQSLGSVRRAGRDDSKRTQRVGGDAARRQRRPLRGHLLLRRVADQPGARPSASAEALVEFERSGRWS